MRMCLNVRGFCVRNEWAASAFAGTGAVIFVALSSASCVWDSQNVPTPTRPHIKDIVATNALCFPVIFTGSSPWEEIPVDIAAVLDGASVQLDH